MRNTTAAGFAALRNGICRMIAGALLLCTAITNAEVPPRFYWKSLSGTNAIPAIGMNVSANFNPLDPSNYLSDSVNIEGELLTAGYARMFTFKNRAGLAAVLLPMGNLRADTTIQGLTSTQSASGYGDPLLEVVINLIGPPAIQNLPDLQRYEPGFSLDLLVDLALPLGEYDNNQSLNIGQNRYYGRIGTPMIWQIGPWIPGRRTTLEVFPSVWLFGDNDDFVGRTLESDPTFELDVHLTRDFTQDLWGSFDVIYNSAGDSHLDGIRADGSSLTMAGFTVGYQLNEGMQLTLGYRTSLNGNDPDDLDLSMFVITLTAGWHSLIEGMKRLGEG